MSQWQRQIIGFGAGLDTAGAGQAPAGQVGLRDALNLDFSTSGALRARPGATRVLGGGYGVRAIDTSNLPDSALVTDLSTTGYKAGALHTLRDRLGERPAVATKGRLYSFDSGSDQWSDRMGFLSARYRRLAETKTIPGRQGPTTTRNDPTWDYPLVPVMGDTFGPSEVNEKRVTLLANSGNPEAIEPISENWGEGSAAKCGTVHAVAFVPRGTNKLVLVTRSGTTPTLTLTTIANDARQPVGNGDAPCICCDFDETHFLLAYWTITANTFALVRVSTAGSVVANVTGTYGTGTQQGIWITNTTVATNRLVLAMTDGTTTGVMTRVFNSTTLADQTINKDMDAGTAVTLSGQVVVGVAEGGEAWVSWLTDAGDLKIGRRSLTANTGYTLAQWGGNAWISDAAGHGSPANAFPSTYNWGIQHQPVKLRNRVVMGVATTAALAGGRITGGGASPTVSEACLWYVIDVTDLHRAGFTTGTLRDPVMLARSAEDQVFPFSPFTAVLEDPGGSGVLYRFGSVRWGETHAGSSTTGLLAIFGDEAHLGLNEIELIDLTSAHARECTVFDGAVPRMVTRDACTPVSWPWMGRPSVCVAILAGGGALAAGSYTCQAVWVARDASGQVHRSAPSYPCTIAGVALNDRLDLRATQPHFNERENCVVHTEFYLTQHDPTGGALHYFVGFSAYDNTVLTSEVAQLIVSGEPSATNRFAYTDGGVLEASFVPGGGGLTTAGARCWISDGTRCYGSRLAEGLAEPVTWTAGGQLTVEIPGQRGRIIGLSHLGNTVVVHCERGTWAFVGEGPDDTGVGQLFSTPEEINALGLAGPRSVITTPRGVVFQAANTQADGLTSTGGYWILDKSLTTAQVSPSVKDYLTTAVADVAWCPEKDQVIFASSSYTLVWDMRANAWTRWEAATGSGLQFNSFAAVAGVWWVHDRSDSTACVYQLSRTDGKDHDSGGTLSNVSQYLLTDDIPFNSDRWSWGRCRSVTLLGDREESGTHTIEAEITLDQGAAVFSSAVISEPETGPTPPLTWPANRYAPEIFLDQQKASVLRFAVTAIPAVAEWTGLELKVKPVAGSRRPTSRTTPV